jgi:hypothetical protein
MESAHIDLVDLGAFLAVYLDRDKMLVQELCCDRIGKAFSRHHMAPVACGVADGEMHGKVAALRVGECLWYPRPPIDGIVRVLAEIGAGRAG